MPMPEVDHPILETISEIGWCSSGGWGPSTLPSSEILAWCEAMGETLTPWEFSMTRRMSGAFVSGAQAERAPYMPVIIRMGLATAAFG